MLQVKTPESSLLEQEYENILTLKSIVNGIISLPIEKKNFKTNLEYVSLYLGFMVQIYEYNILKNNYGNRVMDEFIPTLTIDVSTFSKLDVVKQLELVLDNLEEVKRKIENIKYNFTACDSLKNNCQKHLLEALFSIQSDLDFLYLAKKNIEYGNLKGIKMIQRFEQI